MKKKYLPLLISAMCASSATTALADDSMGTLPSIQVETVKEKLQSTGRLKDAVVQTEVIDRSVIERKQAGNLTEAVNSEPGVYISTDCSMCGAKRITLNGLKGEHTTLLLDGVPNSSIVEGFYGYDAIPTASVSRIEISRGAGAALIAPEAIGGVINVIIDRPTVNQSVLDLAVGETGYQKLQLSSAQQSADKKTALLIAAQKDIHEQVDADNNNISESPQLENRAFQAKLWHDFSDKDTVWVKISDQHSEVFGGPMLGSSFTASKTDAATKEPTNGGPQLEGNNVSGKPGSGASPRDFLESVVSTKQEFTVQWQHVFSDDLNTELTLSKVETEMDAIYNILNYSAKQDINFADIKANYFINDYHLLTVGTDFKQDKLTSKNQKWDETDRVFKDEVPGDAYTNDHLGVYIKDSWTPSANWEIGVALRLDKIDVKFIDQDNRKFDDTLISPRLHVRYDHNFNYTSRLALGQGFRAPLQFFESEHGLLEADHGFEVAVDKLEKANSARYSLEYVGIQTEWTVNTSFTEVENMASIKEINDVPTLMNTDKTGSVGHIDFSISHQLTGHWSIGANLDQFIYDQAYRDSFVILPIEQRIRLMADYTGHDWEVNMTVTAVGERNFKDYKETGYHEHARDTSGTPSSKNHKAPAYFTADIRVNKDINPSWSLYGGIDNVFDYTQAGEGDSPLYYDEDGDIDVTHIWGPLRGRMAYIGTKLVF